MCTVQYSTEPGATPGRPSPILQGEAGAKGQARRGFPYSSFDEAMAAFERDVDWNPDRYGDGKPDGWDNRQWEWNTQIWAWITKKWAEHGGKIAPDDTWWGQVQRPAELAGH